MAFVVKIGGVVVDEERGPLGTPLTIEDVLGTIPQCLFSVRTDLASAPYAVGDSVAVLDGATTYFSGIVTEIREEEMGGAAGKLVHHVQARGTAERLKSRFVIPAREWSGVTIGSIIEDIIDDYASDLGFTYAGVDDGPTLADKVRFTPVDSAYDAIEALARLASLSGERHYWFVDADDDLHFKAASGFPAAAWDITSLSSPETGALQRYRTDAGYCNAVVVTARDVSVGSLSEVVQRQYQTRWYQFFHRILSASGLSMIYDGGAPVTGRTLVQRGVTDLNDAAQYVIWSLNRREVEHTAPNASDTGTLDMRLTYEGARTVTLYVADQERIGDEGLQAARLDLDRAGSVQEMVDAAVAYLEDHAVREAERVVYEVTDPDYTDLTVGTVQSIVRPNRNLSGDFLITSVVRRENRPASNLWTLKVKAEQHERRDADDHVLRQVVRRGQSVNLDSNAPLEEIVASAEVAGATHTFSSQVVA